MDPLFLFGASSSFLVSIRNAWTRRASDPSQSATTNDPQQRGHMTNPQGAIVINMGDLTGNPTTTSPDPKKKQDTLFGPNIGIVSGGPDWTEGLDKSVDELTPEVVKSWIARSKEGVHTTTTLQALVNLKRPTLRLSPLEAGSDEPDHGDSQHHHGLEFEFDCDAPKCGIKVHAVLAPSHPLADKARGTQNTKLLVFDNITDGGFGNRLKLEEGATLELDRFEHHVVTPTSPSASASEQRSEKSPSDTPTPPEPSNNVDVTTAATRHKSLFHLHRRRRSHARPVAGPALAVVDAETSETNNADGEKPKENKESDVGVKVVITLNALDSDGKDLDTRNEQATYLHIVRFGRPPLIIEGEEPEEDARPWVVKVVKREATIGPHTFHLHEIYGLSSNSNTPSHTATAPAPTPVPTSYPPTSPAAAITEDEPSSECLVCLSSPREVVLLPCRHLVACRDCAVNMIEYGAGGQIVQNNDPTDGVTPASNPTTGPTDALPSTSPEETTADAGAGTNDTPQGEEDITNNPNIHDTDPANDGDGSTPAAATATPGTELATPTPAVAAAAPTPATVPRRKRKAKGWACPVCRQPYTSLLRITTVAPSKDLQERTSSELGLSTTPPLILTNPINPITTTAVNAVPLAAANVGTGDAANPNGNSTAPSRWFRGWSSRGQQQEPVATAV